MLFNNKCHKIGPGSYIKDKNLNLIGGHKPSNSVKGFGNGFVSTVARGLETSVFVKGSLSNNGVSTLLGNTSNNIKNNNTLFSQS